MFSFLFRLIPLGFLTILWILQTAWFWSWVASGLVPGLVVEKAGRGLIPFSLHIERASHPLGEACDIELVPDWGRIFLTLSWRLSLCRVGSLKLHTDAASDKESAPPFKLVHDVCERVQTWDVTWREGNASHHCVRDDQGNLTLSYNGHTYAAKLDTSGPQPQLTYTFPSGLPIQATLQEDYIDIALPGTSWQGHVSSNTWVLTDGATLHACGSWNGQNIQGELSHPWVGTVRGSYANGAWQVDPFPFGGGTVNASTKELSFQNIHWQNCELSGKVTWGGNTLWRVDAKTPLGAAALEGHMESDGSITFQGTAPHKTTVQGRIHPTWSDIWKSTIACEGDVHTTLQQFSTGLDENNVIQGDLHAHLVVQGTLAQPEISGFVDIQNGLYHNIECGVWLSPIHIRLRGSGHTWVVEKCIASDRHSRGSETPRGGITGSGRFMWDADNPRHPKWDVTLELDEVDIAHGDRFQGDASGTLHLVGSEPRVEGQVTLHHASVHLDAMDDAESVQVKRKSDISEVVRSDHFVPLDFTLVAPGPIVVDGMGFDSIWQGQIQIKGHITQPQLVGGITCQKGTMNVLGVPMAIEGSQITYVEEDFNIPHLGITAVHILDSKQKIFFNVNGTSERPVAHFTSNMGLNERDIVSRLLFGQSADNISAWQSLQLANVLANLGSRKNKTSWMEQLRQTFGIDSFEVKKVETDRGTTTQTPSIGKRLGGLRLSVDAATNTTPSKATVETFVHPNVSVNADMGGDRSSGVGVDWVYHY